MRTAALYGMALLLDLQSASAPDTRAWTPYRGPCTIEEGPALEGNVLKLHQCFWVGFGSRYEGLQSSHQNEIPSTELDGLYLTQEGSRTKHNVPRFI